METSKFRDAGHFADCRKERPRTVAVFTCPPAALGPAAASWAYLTQ